MSEVIPVTLLKRLEELRPALEHQGVLQLRNGSYRLRYRVEVDGYVQHRSLEVGGAEVGAAVQTILQKWRQEWVARQQEAADARLAMRDAAQTAVVRRRAQLALLYMLDTPRPGWRRRKSLETWWDGLQTDTHAALRFVFTKELPPRGKRGRRIRGLW